MLIKVCGINSAENYAELMQLNPGPNFIGSILYESSPRSCSAEFLSQLSELNSNQNKVLVSVDLSIKEILALCDQFHFSIVQLHSADYTKDQAIELIDQGIEVWKVFSIKHDIPKEVEKWHGYADAFLFDTKSLLHGGSGEQFDWSVLNTYKGPTAFILSGGIGPEDIDRLKHFSHDCCIGIDINSKFELSPGVKNISEVSQFIQSIRN